MGMRYISQRFDIANVPCRIPYALAEDRSGVLVHQPLNGIRIIALGKSNLDPETRQQVSK